MRTLNDKRPKSHRTIENERLLEQIKVIHPQSHLIYGSPRITSELVDKGRPSKNRVARIMNKNGIRSKTVKKYRATTNSNRNLPVVANLLNRELPPSSRIKNGSVISPISQQMKDGYISQVS